MAIVGQGEWGMRLVVPGLAILLLATPHVGTAQQTGSGASPPERYDSAALDAHGNLAILRSTGQTVIVQKEGDQTSFSAPLVSSGHTAVAAQALFPNCCTSYDIPLQLVVYAAGKVHRFRGVGMPIFQWGFADAGTRIAYGQTTVHFGCAFIYELRDIETERLLETIDVPEPCGQQPHPQPVAMPQWVVDLRSRK